MKVEEHNPYQPPQVAAAGGQKVDDRTRYPDASKGVRFLNLLLDYIGFLALSFFIGIVLELVAPGTVSEAASPLTERALGLVIMLAYYVSFEGLFGRTPGKMLTGTKVLTTEGGTPRIAQLFGRTLARFVPFEALSFLGSTDRGWHDRWSGTRVVKTRGQSWSADAWNP